MSASSLLVSLLPAGLALALMPGPNNLLSVQLAASDGVGAACRAALGRLAAFALLLGAAAGGLAVVLRHAPAGLVLVQTAAAAYLLSLAVRLWREARPPAGAAAGPVATGAQAEEAGVQVPAGRAVAAVHPAAKAAWRREFLLALGNPKCLLIATAFVPQCVDPGRPAAPQLLAASLAVLALEALAVGAYAAAGRALLRWLSSPAHWRRFGRACALAMGAAAVALLWRTWTR